MMSEAAGYVGLVSGAYFSKLGVDVVVVDSDEARIASLRSGVIPIYEPGLEKLVADNVREGRLSFTCDLREAIKGVDAVFLAVGTPSRRGDGHADLSFVYAAAEQVALVADGNLVLVTKSTVPVGTGREIKAIVGSARPDLLISVASNPEFLREGCAISDFLRPDRVVIGVDEGISGINEMADLCERVGADVKDVARSMGLDRRIGRKFLRPGPGYGGSCFPKDTLALIRTAQEVGCSLTLVEATAAANDRRKRRMGDRIIAACGGSVRGIRIAILGLTFKPETDDMRDAPSIDVIAHLTAEGAIILAYDPAGMGNAAAILPQGTTFARSARDATTGADAVILLTEWTEFRSLDPVALRASMVGNVMLDLRNAWDPAGMRAAGFRYSGIGRH